MGQCGVDVRAIVLTNRSKELAESDAQAKIRMRRLLSHARKAAENAAPHEPHFSKPLTIPSYQSMAMILLNGDGAKSVVARFLQQNTCTPINLKA